MYFVQVLIAIFTEQVSKFTFAFNDYMLIVDLFESSECNCIFIVVELFGCKFVFAIKLMNWICVVCFYLRACFWGKKFYRE